MPSLDLKDAYFLILIHKSRRKFFRQFKGLSSSIHEFCLNCAPSYLKKKILIRPIVTHELHEFTFQKITQCVFGWGTAQL